MKSLQKLLGSGEGIAAVKHTAYHREAGGALKLGDRVRSDPSQGVGGEGQTFSEGAKSGWAQRRTVIVRLGAGREDRADQREIRSGGFARFLPGMNCAADPPTLRKVWASVRCQQGSGGQVQVRLEQQGRVQAAVHKERDIGSGADLGDAATLFDILADRNAGMPVLDRDARPEREQRTKTGEEIWRLERPVGDDDQRRQPAQAIRPSRGLDAEP